MTWNRGKLGHADRAERICNAGKRAADVLASVGLLGAAEDVRRVCRSNSAYRETTRRLYLDNVELRKRVVELEAEVQQADSAAFYCQEYR